MLRKGPRVHAVHKHSMSLADCFVYVMNNEYVYIHNYFLAGANRLTRKCFQSVVTDCQELEERRLVVLFVGRKTGSFSLWCACA